MATIYYHHRYTPPPVEVEDCSILFSHPAIIALASLFSFSALILFSIRLVLLNRQPEWLVPLISAQLLRDEARSNLEIAKRDLINFGARMVNVHRMDYDNLHIRGEINTDVPSLTKIPAEYRHHIFDALEATLKAKGYKICAISRSSTTFDLLIGSDFFADLPRAQPDPGPEPAATVFTIQDY
ncbi:hypothetical protein DFJ77DRAFT_470092 [Powellomyces hirtus]|nr:hypothetical protein DFJ77DRAFT_470092 [Powellomyces hirtus]